MGFSTIGGAGGGSAETPSGGAGSAEHAGVEDNSSSNVDQLQINDASVVINKDGDDIDFRVAGDTNTHLIFADGATERVGIRTAAPVKGLHVVDGALVKGRATFVLTGSIDVTTNDANVPGTNTKYLSELSIGDDITVSSETRTIKTITNDTTATVSEAWSGDLANDTSPECTPAALSVQRSDGTAVITVNGNRGTALDVTGDTPFVAIRNTAETEAGIFICDDAAPIAQFARIMVDSGSAHSGLTAGFSIMTGGENLTGAINVTASTAVVGVGTAFLTELKVGDRLIVKENTKAFGDSETRAITAIADNTNLTVSPAFSDLGNDSTPAYEARAIQIDRDGTIGMGVRPDTAGEKVALNGSMAFKEQSAAPSATADYCKIVALEDGIDATTVLMLHGDGSDGVQDIIDSSTATTKSCTAVNQTHTDTTVKLYGTAAIQFDGTADYITVPDHADFNMAAGDFTYEFWVRFDAIPDDCGFFGQTQSTGTGGDTYEKGMYCYHEGGDGRIYFRWRSDTTSARRIDVSYLANLQANSWYHMAWVRNGPIITPYLNGRAQDHAEHAHSPTQDDIQVGADTLVDCDGVLEIGKGNAFSMVAGYMEEFRITKGVAKYTSDFTPPGSAFPITRLYAFNSAGGKTMIG